jgi:uncharacterized membrane protein (DUF485 family)
MTVGTARGAPAEAPQAANRSETYDWEAIRELPEYRRLVERRRRFVARGTAIALGTLAIFTALVSFARDAMATELVGGITLALALGVGEMLLTAALGAAYVRIARRDYEPLERAVVAAAERTGAVR